MRPEAIQIIKDEHLAISAVLFCLRFLVKEMREQHKAPNFPLLHAILDYIVSYPDRWHHPKETDFLFAAVERRTREGDRVIAELKREHVEGRPFIEELKTRLLAMEKNAPGAREAFFTSVDHYVESEWSHMRKEEDVLMPLAERVLTDEDWVGIHAAFQENDNPLFGIKPKEDAERLYQKILALAPAPIGFGN